MSLFIAQLGFPDPKLLSAAKLRVLVGSATAAVLGLAIGRALLRSTGDQEGVAHTADEAESSTES